MGNDSPWLQYLSSKNKPLYPLLPAAVRPGDPPRIRRSIRSASNWSCPWCPSLVRNLLGINEINLPYRLEVSQPVLTYADMAKLRIISAYTDDKVHSAELDICYPLAWEREGVESASGLALR